MTFTFDRSWRRAAWAALPLALVAVLTAATAIEAAPARSSAAEAIDTGRAALVKGDGISAEVDLRRALASGVSEDRLAAYLGEAYLQQKDYDSARQWLGPENFSPDQRQHGYHMLARLELALGDVQAANTAFEKALAGNRGTAEIWVDIGRMRYGNGQQHQALEASLKALEIDPKNPRALEFRGQLLRDSEGLLAALPWFERGLKVAPDDIGLLGEYAATLGELGRASEMLRVTRHMIELDGKNPRAFFLQAVMAARAGDYVLARRMLLRTEDKLDDQPAKMLLEGILEMQSGNWGLAVEALDGLSRQQPDNVPVAEIMGRALLENGDAREVVERYAPLADGPDASPYMLTLVGRAYESLGDRKAAAAYLDRSGMAKADALIVIPAGPQGEMAIFRGKDDPFRLDAGVASIRRLIAAGDSSGAAAISARLREHYPDSSDVQVLAGDVALAQGNPAAALASYREAARVRKPSSLIERMSYCLEHLGQAQEARLLVSNYLIEHPRDVSTALSLADMMARAGDWQRARRLLDYSWQLRGNVRDPQSLSMLAEANMQLGNSAMALKQAQTAYRMQRNNSRTVQILARVLRLAGHNAEAEELFVKSARMAIAPIASPPAPDAL